MPAHPGINFDPANLLIYDQEDPASFLDELENKVEVVHCKDARRPAPGAAFGRETILGTIGINALKIQQPLKQLPDILLIIADQNFQITLPETGTVNSADVPPPSLLYSAILPPAAARNWLAIESPIPEPFIFVV